MFAFARLHDLAASRGDGLRPELLELIASRQAHATGNVEELAAHMIEHVIQAGPNPVRRLDGDLPDGVLPFRRLPEQPRVDTEFPAIPAQPSRHTR